MRKVEQIFQGAVDIFAEKGFDRATMDEVAERSGVAKGTLYYHFDGKEDLIAFLMEEGTERLSEYIREAVAGTEDPIEQLRQAIHALVRFFDQNRDFCQLMLVGVWFNRERQTQFRQFLHQFYNHLSGIILSGMEQGQLRPMPAELSATGLFGLVSVVALRVILDGEAINCEQLGDFLFQQYVHGARSQGTSKP
ncbi:TetR family transcriptional regulator [Heliobacterium gestii]|uniref:TetR family transcriptional regulator n=1 Tax=Heliomicrobium gestii TaxID=2699 RepID=A0A845LD39_HELGE|nr:TetR/AcrR family transcriptional regulator [Heliomicrobium gestii]MBM7867715.1 AcrR family transcriptional regulator [Heliomicrobium gestii]MZP44108.1 TetR family transcriptional regulator [Heliomicrobium gestii]